MRIPPFWEKGKYTGIDRNGKECCYSAWGWSFESPEAARADALRRARGRFESRAVRDQRAAYDYLDRPLREEIIQTVEHHAEKIALITRNRYGCLVLNAARVCFVDVDFPRLQAKGLLDGLRMAIFPRYGQARREALRRETVQRVHDWAGSNPHRSFRLYETAAGLRLLFTDKLYSPVSSEVTALFEALQSDWLYRRLTKKQECFRARLTPKPWRCACPRPPNRYPWENDAAEQRYRQWEQQYREKASAYAVCRLLNVFGSASSVGESLEITEIHDAYTGSDSDKLLA